MKAVPLEWTDAYGLDPFVEQSGGRSYFRVAELLRLVELVADLDEARQPKSALGSVKEILPMCKKEYVVARKAKP